MSAWRWLYDGFIVLYAFSLTLYFIDFTRRVPRANRVAFWSLIGVFAILTMLIALELFVHPSMTALAMEKTRLLYAWLLIATSLVLNAVFRMDFFLFFTNLVGFAVSVLNVFPLLTAWAGEGQAVRGELLLLHIVTALFGDVLFVISGIFALMYLLVDILLRTKRPGKQLFRLPPLERLARDAGLFAMIGVPVFTVAVVLGWIWALDEPGLVLYRDPKVLFSLATLLAYGFFVYVRIGAKWPWRLAMLVNIGALVILWVNFWITHSLAWAAWPR
ncbi:MAG: cytochrome c biogenesis protein CcsA [Hydrogenibacillus sp.]|nr:cytochrome c biogenesis protein CcsA [Hydrogenibacillus sp.]